MRASLMLSAVVAVIVGFGGSVAIVLAAAEAVAATPLQAGSWVAALCVSMAVTTGVLSIVHRLPIVTAWSTPGAALIATTSGVTIEQAVGAFLLCAVLLLATAGIRPLERLIARIPAAIASAVLAGVLFPFVIAVFESLASAPALAGGMALCFVLVRLVSAAWAVIAALASGVVLSFVAGQVGAIDSLTVSEFAWVEPSFDPAVLIGLALPLYLVTMASQNLPGFAVLRADGYPVPGRSILGVTGLASLTTAFAGAHTSSLAAITASICTGPDAHPDPAKRWLGGPVYALCYALLALAAASIVGLFASFPKELILVTAGLALSGPLTNALRTSLAAQEDHFPAVITFALTASGVGFFGIGSAFWGLAAGLVLTALLRLRGGAYGTGVLKRGSA